jgi:hypothetical protein
MAHTGKTGADAVFQALAKICRVITAYRAKLDAVITAAEGAGVITADQAATAHDFVATASSVCAVFQLVAGYSGL